MESCFLKGALSKAWVTGVAQRARATPTPINFRTKNTFFNEWSFHYFILFHLQVKPIFENLKRLFQNQSVKETVVRYDSLLLVTPTVFYFNLCLIICPSRITAITTKAVAQVWKFWTNKRLCFQECWCQNSKNLDFSHSFSYFFQKPRKKVPSCKLLHLLDSLLFWESDCPTHRLTSMNTMALRGVSRTLSNI